MDQAKSVYEVLAKHGHTWVIDGRVTEPTQDDVRRVLSKMTEDLSSLEGSVSIQCGGIMLVRDQDKTAVYAYIGDVDEDSSN
jgi:hypothetical protein